MFLTYLTSAKNSRSNFLPAFPLCGTQQPPASREGTAFQGGVPVHIQPQRNGAIAAVWIRWHLVNTPTNQDQYLSYSQLESPKGSPVQGVIISWHRDV